MEKFYFPMETMRITQNWDGTVSHKKHWYNSKNYADYPIDIAGADGGRSAVFAPCKMKVNNIIGIGSGVTNTIWLESVNKVKTPSGEMKVFMALTHWNDNDSAIKKLKIGSIVNEGEIICYEGVDGATANHIHLVCGNADKGTGNKLIQNSNGAWVSNGYCMKPEELMYFNSDFTKAGTSDAVKYKTMPPDDQFFTSKGYFSLGDNHENIGKICNFFAEEFYGYFYHGVGSKEKAHKVLDGDYFGPNLQKWTKTFQKNTGLESDGCVGPKTLAKLQEYGFTY